MASRASLHCRHPQPRIGSHALEEVVNELMGEHCDRGAKTVDLKSPVGEVPMHNEKTDEFVGLTEGFGPFLFLCALVECLLQFLGPGQGSPVLGFGEDQRRLLVAEELLEKVHAVSLPRGVTFPGRLRYRGGLLMKSLRGRLLT